MPPALRQRPVGEQPQQQRDEDQEHRPAFLEHHRHPAQGQRPMMHPVVQDEVLAGGADLHDDDDQQNPSDRISRSAGGEQRPHRGRGHRADRREDASAAGPPVPGWWVRLSSRTEAAPSPSVTMPSTTAAVAAVRARTIVLTRMPPLPAIARDEPTLGTPRSEIVTGFVPVQATASREDYLG